MRSRLWQPWQLQHPPPLYLLRSVGFRQPRPSQHPPRRVRWQLLLRYCYEQWTMMGKTGAFALTKKSVRLVLQPVIHFWGPQPLLCPSEKACGTDIVIDLDVIRAGWAGLRCVWLSVI